MRKKKIKILHVAQAAGGVDRYIRMLLKYLDGRVYKNLSMRGHSEIFLYQTDCPQSSSHQIALFWGQFYALRGMEGALSSVRPRI